MILALTRLLEAGLYICKLADTPSLTTNKDNNKTDFRISHYAKTHGYNDFFEEEIHIRPVNSLPDILYTFGYDAAKNSHKKVRLLKLFLENREHIALVDDSEFKPHLIGYLLKSDESSLFTPTSGFDHIGNCTHTYDFNKNLFLP